MRKTSARLSLSLIAAAVLGAAPATAMEFGLAITSMYYGPFSAADECPQGFALTPEQTLLQSVSAAERKAFEERDKRVGSLATYVSRIVSNRRAPDGRDLCEAPTAVTDPPMRIGQGKVAYGLDLDGGVPGISKPHAEYTSPDGAKGIDNQLARLMSCVISARTDDNRLNQSADSAIRNGNSFILIRVAGVDDLRNDSSVTVEFSKSTDKFIKDGSGEPLPDATYRPDNATPIYHTRTNGKIVDGVLTTDPIDAHFIDNPADMFIREARFQLTLGEDGYSDGMLAGYFDVAAFWDTWSRNGGQQQQLGFSCPAFYRALNDLADGHKDAATGAYTSISSAFKVKAVRSFVQPLGDVKLAVTN